MYTNVRVKMQHDSSNSCWLTAILTQRPVFTCRVSRNIIARLKVSTGRLRDEKERCYFIHRGGTQITLRFYLCCVIMERRFRQTRWMVRNYMRRGLNLHSRYANSRQWLEVVRNLSNGDIGHLEWSRHPMPHNFLLFCHIYTIVKIDNSYSIHR